MKKGTDHSSLPHVTGANETDRMQKRRANAHCVLCVCVRVTVRRRRLQRSSLKEDLEGMENFSIGGPL